MKNKLNLIILIVISLNFVEGTPLFSEKGYIKGIVYSKETGKPLAGTSIRIEKTAFGAIANKKGEFIIRSVKSGNYTLLASLIGYKQLRTEITVLANDTIHLNLYLEEQVIRTEDIIVSASKRVQSVQEVPVSIANISTEELISRNITKLDEVLGYVPGVSMSGDHISIRGSSGFAFGIGSRVILLLDGFPLLSGDVGDIKFDALPIFDISRVEIIKGAGSSLYGTNALGGVINIITKEATEQGSFKARLFSGIYTKPSYKQWVYSDKLHTNSGIELGYSKKFSRLSINSSVYYIEDQSYRKYNDSKRFNFYTKLRYDFASTFNAGLSASISTNNRADWVYWHSLDSATFPSSGTDLSNRALSDKYMLFADAMKIFDNNNFLSLKSGIYTTIFKNTYPTNHSDYRQSDAIAFNNELQYNSKLFKDILLTSGINYTYHEVSSKTYGNRNQYLFSVFEQAEYQPLMPLIITAGFRLDYEKTQIAKSNFEFSPKIGAIYKLDSNNSIRFSSGRGFRAASIAERFASVDFQGFKVIENPNLKSEVSWNFEIGGNSSIDLNSIKIYTDLTFFFTRLSYLIEPTFSTNSYYIKFDNITDSRIFGLELNIKGYVDKLFGFETSVTGIDPRNLYDNRTLKYRHNVLWYNKIFIPYNCLELQLEYRFMSKVERIDEELKLQVRDYDARVPIHIVDTRLIFKGKEFNFPLDLVINAKNLLNYYYTYMVGNLGMTRYVGFQIEGSF